MLVLQKGSADSIGEAYNTWPTSKAITRKLSRIEYHFNLETEAQLACHAGRAVVHLRWHRGCLQHLVHQQGNLKALIPASNKPPTCSAMLGDTSLSFLICPVLLGKQMHSSQTCKYTQLLLYKIILSLHSSGVGCVIDSFVPKWALGLRKIHRQ